MEHSCAMNAQYMQHSFCNATFEEVGGGGGGTLALILMFVPDKWWYCWLDSGKIICAIGWAVSMYCCVSLEVFTPY